jgi:hypothetical protein
MASYFQNLTASLPSFTSSANSPPPRGTLARPPPRPGPDSAQQTTTSNLSSLGSALSSRLTSLRRALTSGAEDDDPDSEDSSHISKVLRAYYTEKGRPFPNWLPPDPKAPAPPLMPVQQQSQWGGFNQQQGAGRGSGGGLSDLWEEKGPGQGQGPPTGPTSLRGPGRGAAPSPRPGFAGSQPSSASSLGGRGRAQSPGLGPDYGGGGARPLPSQRAGSYQQQQSSFSSQGARRPPMGASDESFASNTSVSSTGSGGMSARERLRQGLSGGRSSPQPQTPPASQQSFRSDRTASSQGSSYRDERQDSYGSGRGGGGGGYGQREQKPFTSASSPWVGGEDPYAPGGGGMGYGSTGGDAGYGPGGQQGGGLGRRVPPGAGGGLPSGPKPRGPR